MALHPESIPSIRYALPLPTSTSRSEGESAVSTSSGNNSTLSPINRENLSPRGLTMGLKHLAAMIALLHLAAALTSTEPTTSSTTTKFSTTEKLATTTTQKSSTVGKETTATSSTTRPTTSSTRSPTTSSTTVTPPPSTSTEWQDMGDDESEKLVNFVVGEIQKLKVEHKELDECQELNLSSVLSGKKLSGKVIKYSVTLKVQPQFKNTEACLQQNTTVNNMHPEICEADVTEGDHGGTEGKTLLRSTCLQVEELQD